MDIFIDIVTQKLGILSDIVNRWWRYLADYLNLPQNDLGFCFFPPIISPKHT